VPDETTILRFLPLLEKNQLVPQVLAAINIGLARQGLRLETGTIMDVIHQCSTCSTKDKKGERDPDMHQTKKVNQ
jgi:IS5 family transposase